MPEPNPKERGNQWAYLVRRLLLDAKRIVYRLDSEDSQRRVGGDQKFRLKEPATAQDSPATYGTSRRNRFRAIRDRHACGRSGCASQIQLP
jgi:hypothetical protein